jgi:hypothetical protein
MGKGLGPDMIDPKDSAATGALCKPNDRPTRAEGADNISLRRVGVNPKLFAYSCLNMALLLLLA